MLAQVEMHFGMSCGLAIKWPFAVDREDLKRSKME